MRRRSIKGTCLGKISTCDTFERIKHGTHSCHSLYWQSFWWPNHDKCCTCTHFTNVHALCASFYSQPPHLSLFLWHKKVKTEVCGKYFINSPPHIFFLEFFNILVQAHVLTLIIGMTQSITFVPTVYILPFITLRIHRMINWQHSQCYIDLCAMLYTFCTSCDYNIFNITVGSMSCGSHCIHRVCV